MINKLNEIKKETIDLIGVVLIIMLVIGFVSVGVLNFMNSKHYKVITDDEVSAVLVRDLNHFKDKFPEDPVDRDFAWDSELPDFIKNDIQKLLDEEVEEIWYVFDEIEDSESGNIIKISLLYGTDIPYWDFGNGNDVYIWDINNCSIYKTEDGFVVYGEDSKSFNKININKSICDNTILTFDTKLPFSEMDNLFHLELPNGYQLCVEKDAHTVRLWDKGNLIQEITVNEKITDTIDNRWLYTTNHKVYMPYVIEGLQYSQLYIEEIKEIDFSELERGSYHHFVDDYNFPNQVFLKLNEAVSISFPILMWKSGIMEVLIPQDISLYTGYQTGTKKLAVTDNLKWMTVSLKESFVKAEICFSKGDIYDDFNYRAYADIYFKLDGDFSGIYRYKINGFDENVLIPNEIPEKQIVYTEERFWEAIQNIRNIFAREYDYPEQQ